jgi:hypothetical protein
MQKYSTEQLINDLKRVEKIIGKIPSYIDYEKYSICSADTITRRFGKWTTAISKTFGKNIRTPPKARIKHPCPKCQTLTKNLKFCSHSCSATFNNKLKTPNYKPKITYLCNCGKVTKRKSSICQNCFSIKKIESYGEKLLSSFSSKYARHKYQNVRHHAHRFAELHNLRTRCKICNYEHTQLCHIKRIGDFDKNTKIKEINSKENIIFLCPTHHWELDNNILKLVDSSKLDMYYI